VLDLADQLASIGTRSIAQNSTDALDRIVGGWDAIESCSIRPDRATATSDGRNVSVEGDLVAVRHSGERVETRVLVSADDLDDPHCAPVIEPLAI
jgi:2-polyprenyl-6-methoxyphenol hydroxylase-like FAD-dependent oxidoreductase